MMKGRLEAASGMLQHTDNLLFHVTAHLQNQSSRSTVTQIPKTKPL
jgi:hypothetical protein